MEQMLIFVVCMILLSIVFVPSAAEVIDQLVQEQRCAGRCFGDAYQAALHMARMQQPLGIGEDAVQMTILRPVHSLIRTAPHVENLGCERTRVVRWRIHKYLLCLEIGLSQNIFHVLRYFGWRSEEHTSELQSLMRISYAVFCLKKKNRKLNIITNTYSITVRHKRNITQELSKHVT